jgi:hypothetical protein
VSLGVMNQALKLKAENALSIVETVAFALQKG